MSVAEDTYLDALWCTSLVWSNKQVAQCFSHIYTMTEYATAYFYICFNSICIKLHKSYVSRQHNRTFNITFIKLRLEARLSKAYNKISKTAVTIN